MSDLQSLKDFLNSPDGQHVKRVFFSKQGEWNFASNYKFNVEVPRENVLHFEEETEETGDGGNTGDQDPEIPEIPIIPPVPPVEIPENPVIPPAVEEPAGDIVTEIPPAESVEEKPEAGRKRNR